MVSATIIKPNLSKSISKTRYTVTASSWSASANADGYYTYSVSLSPSVGSSPDVYIAGSADGTQPTDTEKGQFAYVKRCKVNGSTLTLYASSKPSSTFYIWVEGVNGTGSGDIVGNVIQPNGAVSGGFNKTLIHSYTIAKSDFGAVDSSGRRTGEKNITSDYNDIIGKTLYVEFYETNYFGYWKKYMVCTPAIILNNYFSGQDYHTAAFYGDPSKYYGFAIELNPVAAEKLKIVIRVMDNYYSNSMPSDDTIVVNIYEIS